MGQEINVQNINVELVAQMFKNYRSNVLFHLEGTNFARYAGLTLVLNSFSNGQPSRSVLMNVLEEATTFSSVAGTTQAYMS